MTGSTNALQAAVFAALSDDTALLALIGPDRLFDHRRTSIPMPYVVLGEIETRDFGPDTEEHVFTIEAWSDAAGRKQAQAIAARVKAVLDNAPLPLSDLSLVNLQHRTTRVRREAKTRAIQAEISFRAVTE